ncbi:acyl-CoA dehydratase activase [Tepidibacter thalassicus]|uniref:CoA-substrate-specific enzyme activase, putative n=1 Tax=Tepidibacter thalassicus DSM 15285 TaxID=1123350 RepID=A0A1M5SNN2_9FIRM|nr:acyl-CoA dehydratase activase [Tepidibacter thalassicus]SHH40147.1 CoA-substrate-specific enzyme activase, putative [Tepidibacter thalassicus DSM 15285]
MKNVYLGIDVGSVSTNIVIIDENNNLLEKLYIRTMGNPINVLKEGLGKIKKSLKNLDNIQISGVGTTGSGRELASVMVGADIVKNEITAHAIAALNFVPGVKTILEIGGQDSKIILLRNNVISDFAMNTVCAAGTGSFLDRQASRLGIPIEEFGKLALNSTTQVRIAGRCAVFAESDMIHKQQLGYSQEDIINGLCEALVRNYLNNLAKGKDIQPPIVFQGGVAANIGIKKAFEKALGYEIHVPKYHNVMGAIGAALLAKEKVKNKEKSNFLGFNITDKNFKVKGFECDNCPNVCEIIGIYRDDELVARWGDKCGKWSNLNVACSFE